MLINDLNEFCVDDEQTVGEFLSQFELAPDFTAKKFIDTLIVKITSAGQFIDQLDKNNYQRIISHYTKEELELFSKTIPENLIIKSGTSVVLSNGVIKRQVTKSNIVPDTIKLTDYKPFIAKALRDLFTDPNYISIIKNQNDQEILKEQINDISVYIWIRSSTFIGSNYQEGYWYDISSFVEYAETSVNGQLGSFALGLTPVAAVYDKVAGWVMDNVIGRNSGGIREDILSTASISKYEIKNDSFLRRNDFLFDKVLQENDLVYIRFEGLESEKRNKLFDRSFGPQDVPGNIYDMIGLIDVVNTSSSSRDKNITVSGRDLMKLLVEDGSIFFPEQIGAQIFNNPDSILTQRNLIEAESRFLSAAATSFKPVSTILKYIFNKFSSIGLIPNSVFNSYGLRAQAKKYSIVTDNTIVQSLNNKFLQEERQGLWRIIEFVFDPSAANRVLADNSISTDNGSIINSIKKVCQEPFVEFRGDTYGDKYYFIVRKMPFDAQGYRGMVYKDVEVEDIKDGINVLGNISRTKNYLTSSIKKGLRNISRNSVPEINNAIVLPTISVKDTRLGRESLISDLVIDIKEQDIINDSLSYSNDAYSWYRIIPRGLGVRSELSSFMLASIVVFDEYAEVFGNKSYEIEYNYSPTEFIDSSVTKKEMEYAESQAFYDLQYIIQSHAYLPFTRQGTITINGDRRIKSGMMIYYVPTDEIFYVDAVRNVRTLNDRYTILTVSRGMIEKYIKGKVELFGAKPEKVSYFDIINTSIDTNASIKNSGFLKNWSVNRNIFNFFLQRRQFVK